MRTYDFVGECCHVSNVAWSDIFEVGCCVFVVLTVDGANHGHEYDAEV
jgi:hypothetical protein